MDLISQVANTEYHDEALNSIREAVGGELRRIQGRLEDVSPDVAGQMVSTLLEALILGYNRTGDELLLKQARKHFNGLLDAVAPLLKLDDCPVDPQYLQRLYSLCAQADFRIAARDAMQLKYQGQVDAAEEAGINTDPQEGDEKADDS